MTSRVTVNVVMRLGNYESSSAQERQIGELHGEESIREISMYTEKSERRS